MERANRALRDTHDTIRERVLLARYYGDEYQAGYGSTPPRFVEYGSSVRPDAARHLTASDLKNATSPDREERAVEMEATTLKQQYLTLKTSYNNLVEDFKASVNGHAALCTEKEQTARRIAKLLEEYKTTASERDVLAAKNDVLVQDVHRTSSELAEATAQRDANAKALHAARTEAITLRSKTAAARKAEKEGKDEAARLKEHVDSLRAELASLKSSNRAGAAARNAHSRAEGKARAKMEERTRAAEERITLLERQLRVAESQVREGGDRTRQALASKKEMNQQLKRMEAQLGKAEAAQSQANVDRQLEGLLKDKEACIQRMRAEHISLKKQYAEQRQVVQELERAKETDMGAKAEDAKRLARVRADANAKIKTLEKENKELRALLDEAEDKNKTISSRCEKADRRAASARKRALKSEERASASPMSGGAPSHTTTEGAALKAALGAVRLEADRAAQAEQRAAAAEKHLERNSMRERSAPPSPVSPVKAWSFWSESPSKARLNDSASYVEDDARIATENVKALRTQLLLMQELERSNDVLRQKLQEDADDLRARSEPYLRSDAVLSARIHSLEVSNNLLAEECRSLRQATPSDPQEHDLELVSRLQNEVARLREVEASAVQLSALRAENDALRRCVHTSVSAALSGPPVEELSEGEVAGLDRAPGSEHRYVVEQLSEARERNSALHAQVRTMSVALQSLREDLMTANAAARSPAEAEAVLRARLAEREEALERCQESLREAARGAGEARQRHAGEVARMQPDLSELRGRDDRAELRAQVARQGSLEAQGHVPRKTATELRGAEVERLEAEVERLEDALSACEHKWVLCSSMCSRLQDELREAHGGEAQARDTSRREQRLDDSMAEVARLEASLGSSESVRTHLEEKLASSDSVRTHLEEKLASSDSLRTHLEEKLASSDSLRTQLEEKLASSDYVRTQLEEKLASSDSLRTQLEEKLASSDSVRTQLEEKLAAVQGSKVVAEGDTPDEKQRDTRASSEVARLQTSASTECGLEQCRSRASRLRAELAIKEDECARLAVQNARLEQEVQGRAERGRSDRERQPQRCEEDDRMPSSTAGPDPTTKVHAELAVSKREVARVARELAAAEKRIETLVSERVAPGSDGESALHRPSWALQSTFSGPCNSSATWSVGSSNKHHQAAAVRVLTIEKERAAHRAQLLSAEVAELKLQLSEMSTTSARSPGSSWSPPVHERHDAKLAEVLGLRSEDSLLKLDTLDEQQKSWMSSRRHG